MTAYTPRVQRAMQFAADRHEGRRRRITGAAFITHPLAVVLVLSDAGVDDEDVLVSAVLHDVVEDEPVDRAEIAARFGDRVGELVAAMTEPDADAEGAQLPWGDRKAHIVEVARTTEDGDLLALKAADLIANATDLDGEHDRIGDDVFSRFGSHGGIRQIGYYLDLARTLDGRPLPSVLAAEIAAIVASLERLSECAAHMTTS